MNNELPKGTFVNEDKLPDLCIINRNEKEKEKIMDEIDLNYDSLHQMPEGTNNIELNEKLGSNILEESHDLDFNDSSVILYSCNEIGEIENVLNKDVDDISGNNSDSSEESTSSFELKISQMSSQDLLKVVKDIYHEKYLLEEENKSLQNELDSCKADNSSSTYQATVEALEKDLAQAKADAFAWQNELSSVKEKFAQENINIRTDLTTRLERLMKQYEAANREKESMVVKYAVAEKDVLVVKKQKENIEKKLKDIERDKEILQGKIKTLNTEKTRTCGTLDNKIQELGVANRTIDKLRDEINAKDIKIKWGQTKLRSEIDAHKETQSKLDRALAKICNHEEEIQLTREEAEKVVKEAKEGENTRANILDKQLQETKALLIMEKQKFDDTNSLYRQLKSEHENLQSTHILISTEANTLKVKVHKYEQEREESEKLFQSLQSELKNLKQGKADLAEMLSHSAGYAEQLESERNKLRILEEEKKELESKLEDLTFDLAKCKEKEGELLVFTQKLTDKNVTVQSQLTAAQGKIKLMEVDDKEMRSQVNKLEAEVVRLSKELSQLKVEKKSEKENWTTMLQEKTKECSILETKVSDLLNEIHVLQRKHANSLKDSNREIQKLRKKLDGVESQQPSSHTPTSTPNVLNGDNGPCDVVSSWSRQDCLSQESRASSDISLHTVDSSQINGVTPSYSVRDPSANSPITDLPQQVLIDRIVKLQKLIVKKSEKCEFLEEHVSQLIGELKKKNKIIHHYIMREDAGALINSKSDENKAEIIKHGGIMASVYGSSPKDGTMTLELSLEINKKLQAVLEDTLLKNITLKENLNTLGDEVAKLALQNSKVP